MVQQIAFGPRIRRSPFFKATQAAGASHFSIYNKMYFPVAYGDPAAEYDRLVNAVALWDVAVERQVRIKGPDALTLVRTLTPRNLASVKTGQGRYVPVCDHRGTLINDPVLLPISEDEYWLSIADNDLILWVRAVAFERGMKVEVSEPDVSPLAVQGPKAVDVIRDLFGDWATEMKHFAFTETELNGIPLILGRSGWSRQGGYELYLLESRRGTDFWNMVAEAGEAYGIGPGAPNYIERIESGLLSMGADTDTRTNPYEVGMDKLVDVEQETDFIGKQALRRIRDGGVRRLRCGFFVHGDAFQGPNQQWWKVIADGARVGFVSAAAYSPRIGRNIGLGLIDAAQAEPGTKLIVETEHGRRSATVSDLPFDIPKG